MGWRYRKSKKLPGGFRINFSKSGIGYSWGTKHYRITKTANGKVRNTYTFPGGVSYVAESSNHSVTGPVVNEAPYYTCGDPRFQNITKRLKRFKFSIISALLLIMIGAILYFNMILCTFFSCLGIGWIIYLLTFGRTEIPISDKNGKGQKLMQLWKKLASSEYIWQINPAATRETEQLPVQIKPYRHRPYIKCDSEALSINLNAGKMVIVKGKIILFNGYDAGIIRARDLTYTYQDVNFADEIYHPSDCTKVGSKYRHANADGSADRRYKDNPVVNVNRYGVINISSPTGLCISLMVSNAQLAQKFVDRANRIYVSDEQIIKS